MQHDFFMPELKHHPSEDLKWSWPILKWLFIISTTFVLILFLLNFNQLLKTFFLVISIGSFVMLMILEYLWMIKNQEKNSTFTGDTTKISTNYQHADNLYHQRFNFFLVAESMLVVSFATSLLIHPDNSILTGLSKNIRTAISLLGMIFTVSWFYVNKRLDWRLVFLNSEFLKSKNEYKDYLDSVSKYSIHSGFFMSNLLPTMTFFFWYYLLYITVIP